MSGRPRHPTVGADPILRLLAADLVGEPAVKESLLTTPVPFETKLVS